MKRSQLHKIVLLFVALLWCGVVKSQSEFPFSVKLEKIEKTGAYRIDLTPEIISRTTRNLADIRITDEKNQQVPYLIRTELPVFRENNFLQLNIASAKTEADKQTHIVLENPSAKIISALFLVVRNNEAQRTVSLSGSDDKKQWYVIKENLLLNDVPSTSDDRYIQVLEFPKSSYRFFDIIINGKNLLPVNIIKAGTYEDLLRSGKFTRNPSPVINQQDSGNNSYVYTRFRNAFRTDEIEIKLSGAKYFQRNCTIIEKQLGREVARQTILLRSDNANRFSTSFKSSELELVIENEDNPPLRVDSIRSFQLNRYLFAFLDSMHNYQLGFGDSSLQSPRFEINYFRDSLLSNVMIAKTDSIKSNLTNTVVQKKDPLVGKTLLWVIIGGVLVVLLFLTFRMAKEVNKKG